jgi:Coenzyme PQQ synthesis protein D (PqqD)
MVTLDSIVKLANDVIFQDLDGEAVLLNMRTEIYFGLDAVGTRIWQLLEKHADVRTVSQLLLEHYDITEDQLQNHLLEFIEKLQSKGLVEIQRS